MVTDSPLTNPWPADVTVTVAPLRVMLEMFRDGML